MRIGVDAVPLQKLHGGISYYIFFLLDELIQIRTSDTFFLFINEEIKDGEINRFKNYHNVHICLCPPSCIGHSLWSQTVLSYACWQKKIDVFWGTTQSIPILKRRRTKTIITVYDFVYKLCPETMSVYKRLYFQLFCRWMFKMADVILPISYGTGAKLQQFYGLGYHTVISPPMKPQVYFQEHRSDDPLPHALTNKNYLVTIGTLEPRKNLLELIRVYIDTLEQYATEAVLPLVIVGGGGWKNKRLLNLLAEVRKKYPHHFYLMGYLTDLEISKLLSGARYHIMVSKYEGYGMPIAESRMCKTPSICLDQPEMREAAEDDGYFLNPQTWKEDIKSYLLTESKIEIPLHPKYLSNRSKALKISEIIDSTYST